MERADSWMWSVLSSLAKLKSGAGLPTRSTPDRACIHSVSNGRTRKAAGCGIFAITRANCSGDPFMTLYSPMQAITQTPAITHNVTSVRLTILDFVLTRFVIEPQKEVVEL